MRSFFLQFGSWSSISTSSSPTWSENVRMIPSGHTALTIGMGDSEKTCLVTASPLWRFVVLGAVELLDLAGKPRTTWGGVAGHIAVEHAGHEQQAGVALVEADSGGRLSGESMRCRRAS